MNPYDEHNPLATLARALAAATEAANKHDCPLTSPAFLDAMKAWRTVIPPVPSHLVDQKLEYLRQGARKTLEALLEHAQSEGLHAFESFAGKHCIPMKALTSVCTQASWFGDMAEQVNAIMGNPSKA